MVRILFSFCVRETVCDVYIMSPESQHVGVVDKIRSDTHVCLTYYLPCRRYFSTWINSHLGIHSAVAMVSQGGMIGLPIAIEPLPRVLLYLFPTAFIKIDCVHKRENVARQKTENEM